MKNVSLYIHIPFCVRKCNYCDFLSAACDEETRKRYVGTLCEEITDRAEAFRSKTVDTIFFGGGTPSLLSVEQISKIMSVIRKNFLVHKAAEITLEMNPGTVDREKLECYKKLGINRLSIGLQSASNEELKVLGRIHTWETFVETWKMVREVGFSNVNIDLMSALPGQTLESYEETLQKVLDLKPEHISAYSLIIEEGTLFYDWYGEGQERAGELPDEITDRQMYELTKKRLEQQGYYRYEISNYALKGFECKHNIGYWKRKEYLGLGLGAASLLLDIIPTKNFKKNKAEMDITKENKAEWKVKNNIRCSNITDLECYLKAAENGKDDTKSWTEECEVLSKCEQMEEFMFLGLRMMEGVNAGEFQKEFGQSIQQVYGVQIKKLIEQGLLKFSEETDSYALTTKGIDVSNQVFVEFMN